MLTCFPIFFTFSVFKSMSRFISENSTIEYKSIIEDFHIQSADNYTI